MYQAQSANGYMVQQPMQQGGAVQTNELKLIVTFRTDEQVHMSWNAGSNKDKLEEYPFKLKYFQLPQQVGVTQHITIAMPDNYYTQSTLELPGEKYKGKVVFVPGRQYRFILQAQLRNTASFVCGVADVQIADGPCLETISDIMESADFLKRFCMLVDPKPKLHQIIACKFGIKRDVYNTILYYKDPDQHPVSERLLKHICDVSGDEEKIMVCYLLKVVKEHGPKNVLKELFEWHTGRPDGNGPCRVCTRDMFG